MCEGGFCMCRGRCLCLREVSLFVGEVSARRGRCLCGLGD